jgi:hypothetical protein
MLACPCQQQTIACYQKTFVEPKGFYEEEKNFLFKCTKKQKGVFFKEKRLFVCKKNKINIIILQKNGIFKKFTYIILIRIGCRSVNNQVSFACLVWHNVFKKKASSVLSSEIRRRRISCGKIFGRTVSNLINRTTLTSLNL